MPWSGFRHTCGGALRLGLDDRPQPPRHALAAARMEQDRVERRPEDVVLALVEGAVADPHRVGSGVPGELVARGLGQVAAPVDPVHDLERPVLVRLEVGDELHELVGLPVQVQEVQRLQREGRVADPGEAVVPVALSARRLGQRGGERRDRGAGRHVGEALDRQRRALDRPRASGGRWGEPGAARRARSAWWRRAERWPRRCSAARRGPRPRRASSRPARPARGCAGPCTRSPSTPSAMSVCSLIVWPAPVASAA